MRNRSRRPDSATTAGGFQLSDEPLVHLGGGAKAEEELPASYGTDALYSIARNPSSLFIYWDVNWARVFGRAGFSPRPAHLRVYRAEGEIESTREINPFRGHCYVEVATAGADYACEIGCFEGENWKPLLRSGPTTTPRGAPSDDLSATFATLPIHLSFQQLLDIFEATEAAGGELAHEVAKLQAEAFPPQPEVLPQSGTQETNADVLATLRRAAAPRLRPLPVAVQERLWAGMAEGFGSASESSFAGSSQPSAGE